MDIETIKKLCPEFKYGKKGFEYDAGELIRALSLLAEAREALEWRPIAEAPKNETTVDLWVVGTPFPDKPKYNVGFRLPDCWYCPDEKAWLRTDGYGEVEKVKGKGLKITHWMPLPQPPKEGG